MIKTQIYIADGCHMHNVNAESAVLYNTVEINTCVLWVVGGAAQQYYTVKYDSSAAGVYLKLYIYITD